MGGSHPSTMRPRYAEVALAIQPPTNARGSRGTRINRPAQLIVKEAPSFGRRPRFWFSHVFRTRSDGRVAPNKSILRALTKPLSHAASQHFFMKSAPSPAL